MIDVTNALLRELQLLARELNKLGIQPIIGGGMGLYLRQTRIGLPDTSRYDIVPPLRPTQDIDTFITEEVIVDGEKWRDSDRPGQLGMDTGREVLVWALHQRRGWN